MSATPQTRNSLILRLRDRRNDDAWREFVGIYEPVIFRLGRRRGLQHADATELVQRVMLAVAKAVDRWEPDPDRGRFRSWLFRIAHNELCKHVARSGRQQGTGDSRIQALLEQSQMPDDAVQQLATEYRRSVFRWAAHRIEQRVRPSSWLAFWRTAVDGEAIDTVANELEMSKGAVYIARSRIMAQLRQEVQQFEREVATVQLPDTIQLRDGVDDEVQ